MKVLDRRWPRRGLKGIRGNRYKFFGVIFGLAAFLLLLNIFIPIIEQDGVRISTDVGSDIRLTICVLTNRLEPLKRLLNSLSNAEYPTSSPVGLTLISESNAAEPLIKYVEDFTWDHGNKRVRVKNDDSDLPAAVESWYPSSDQDYVLILEGDVEVSPYYFKWLAQAIDGIKHSDVSHRIYGVSLYTPRVVETTNPDMRYYPDRELASYAGKHAYLHQVPCSWGALYFPKHWTQFYKYMLHRLENPETFLLLSDERTKKWPGSWRRFYSEYAWLNSLFMLYPNLPNQTSFSTLYVDPSTSKGRGKGDMAASDYEVPLLRSLSDAPLLSMGHEAFQKLPTLDLFSKTYNIEESNVTSSFKAYQDRQCNKLGGYGGTRMGESGIVSSPGFGNKMLSGYELRAGASLTSTPQHEGDHLGSYFVGVMTKHGIFEVQLMSNSGQYVKTVFTVGQRVSPSEAMEYSLQLDGMGVLSIRKMGCVGKEATEAGCESLWSVAPERPRSSDHTLMIRQDGNLGLYEGCACSVLERVWDNEFAEPGFIFDQRQCIAFASDLDKLVPGDALTSVPRKTMVSEKDSAGHVFEAVMQPDGNLVVFRKAAGSAPEPVFNIKARVGKQAGAEGVMKLVMDLDGNLRIVAVEGGKETTLWQSGFHGVPRVAHFLKVTHVGTLEVYQGFSECDHGVKVWSSHNVGGLLDGYDICPNASDVQDALLCRQESNDIYNFFSDADHFTVLLSSFSVQRSHIVSKLIAHLTKSPVVSCVLVVWHQPFHPLPDSSIVNGKLVRYLTNADDSLNNRFYPSQHITTEAVLVLDDDLYIHADDLALMFEAWRKFPDRVVGVFPRWFSYRKAGTVYNFQSEDEGTDGYPIVLTKASMVHRKFLYEYSCGMGRSLRATVHQLKNCEDIAMNFLVAKATGGAAPMYVQPIHVIGDYGKAMPDSLQKRGVHSKARTDCLRAFEHMMELQLPMEKMSVYGTLEEGVVTAITKMEYTGVTKHHVDCFPGERIDGCDLEL